MTKSVHDGKQMMKAAAIGRQMPMLGQGTWLMGTDPAKRNDEIAALWLGLDLGMSLIDTAEMYGEGAAEELVADVIAGRRAEVFLVSKVYPHNASVPGVIEACERSLRRLRTDYLDCYLLHWRGAVSLAETAEAFQRLKSSGKILDYGISNFDVDDMVEWMTVPGGADAVVNQVLYNPVHRGIEWDLLPWCRERDVRLMAYSPVGHGGTEKSKLLANPTLRKIAEQHDATAAQIAIAWLLMRDVVAIPKASRPEHVRENRAAADIELTEDDLLEIDRAFPPPKRKVPLEVK
jgi:diketogulonate reductase-like aldo/keto reductase